MKDIISFPFIEIEKIGACYSRVFLTSVFLTSVFLIMVVTFLPYTSFKKSLESLDRQRLTKQRLEAFQIISCIKKGSGGWSNHPATKMWKDYLPALIEYYNLSLIEFANRGYNNVKLVHMECKERIVYPWWLGYEPLHLSHQAVLIRKKPDHYIELFGDNFISESKLIYLYMGYIWPSNVADEKVIKIKKYRSEMALKWIIDEKMDVKDPFFPGVLCETIKRPKGTSIQSIKFKKGIKLWNDADKAEEEFTNLDI